MAKKLSRRKIKTLAWRFHRKTGISMRAAFRVQRGLLEWTTGVAKVRKLLSRIASRTNHLMKKATNQ